VSGDLAARQAELVRALIAGGAVPDGFAAGRVAIARKALLRKRARNVRRDWPHLAAEYGDRWEATFSAWADGRPSLGGYEFAKAHPPTTRAARIELIVYQARTRPLTLRIGRGLIVAGARGRVWLKLW
jgi:hypothetical protein